MAHGGTWKKSSPELVERFHEAVAGVEGVEVRPMFGYPAAFIGGNMTAGLHQESFIVRLPDDDLAARLADGWTAFEPMPGRPMRGYVALPPEVVADVAEARVWIERAAAYVRTLLPSRPASRRPSRPRRLGLPSPRAGGWRCRSQPRPGVAPGRRRPRAAHGLPRHPGSTRPGPRPKAPRAARAVGRPRAGEADRPNSAGRRSGAPPPTGRPRRPRHASFGAAVMDDEGGRREEGSMVDGVDAPQVRRGVAVRQRSLHDDPAPGAEHPIDRGAQLRGRHAPHGPERHDDGRWAVLDEALQRSVERCGRRPVEPRAGDMRSPRQVRRDSDD